MPTLEQGTAVHKGRTCEESGYEQPLADTECVAETGKAREERGGKEENMPATRVDFPFGLLIRHGKHEACPSAVGM